MTGGTGRRSIWTPQGGAAVVVDVALVLAVFASVASLPSFSGKPKTLPIHHFARGDVLGVDSIEWSAARSNIVLVLSKGCNRCEPDYEFYGRLSEEFQRRSDVRLLVAYYGSVQNGRRFAQSVGSWATSIEIGSLQPPNGEMVTIPSVILADSKGAVLKEWSGHLSRKAMDEISGTASGPGAN